MSEQQQQPPPEAVRTSLNGCWVLDKTVEPWSMNAYLKIMDVDPLAIQAHEKGELETDTYHTIELDRRNVKITKRSRVNNDLEINLQLNQEKTDYLPPGNRPLIMLAQSQHPGHLCIQSSLQTVNGKASVVDTKQLVVENNESGDGDKTTVAAAKMVQELTITNEQTGQSHTTVRHFKPYCGTPPHLVAVPEAPMAVQAKV